MTMTYDSADERNFYLWCLQARKHGYVLSVDRAKSYDLSSPKKYRTFRRLKGASYKTGLKKGDIQIKELSLLSPCSYQPDFDITITPEFREILIQAVPELVDPDVCPDNRVVVEIKSHSKFRDREKGTNMRRKWLYEKHGIYVPVIRPDELFKKLWRPTIVNDEGRSISHHKRYADMIDFPTWLSSRCGEQMQMTIEGVPI